MNELFKFVVSSTVRGECKCGKCIDVGDTLDPQGHTVNLTFFIVGLFGSPDKAEFIRLAEAANIMPPADGTEKSFIHLGAELGDQQFALLTMALGDLLGVWEVLCPERVVPLLDDDTKHLMAGRGMVTYKNLESVRISR